MFTNEQKAQLNEPIPRSVVATREGGRGKTLSYLEQHYVNRRLNEIFGQDGWSMEVLNVQIRPHTEYEAYGKAMVNVGCMAHVRLRIGATNLVSAGMGLVKDGIGYGTASNPKIHDAEEQACKSAVSDALKTAAYRLGDALGLALYDKTQERVTDEQVVGDAGKSQSVVDEIRAAKSVDELRAIWSRFSVPERERYSSDLAARKAELEGGGAE